MSGRVRWLDFISGRVGWLDFMSGRVGWSDFMSGRVHWWVEVLVGLHLKNRPDTWPGGQSPPDPPSEAQKPEAQKLTVLAQHQHTETRC